VDPSSGIEGQFAELDFSTLRLPPRGEITPPLAELANSYDAIVWPGGRPQNPLKAWFGELYYSFVLKGAPEQDYILVVCSMRSGSTLLKALLANHPEVSHLPETDFQRFAPLPHRWEYEMRKLADDRHLVLKQPCSFRDCNTYPILPARPALRELVLFRDPAQTVLSLRAMNQVKSQYTDLDASDLVSYWCNTYERIVDRIDPRRGALYVSYDSIVTEPQSASQRILRWMGLESDGYISYSKPEGFEWKWNIDDGGPVIKTLKVQRRDLDPRADALREILFKVPRVREIYEALLEREAMTRADT
jgi:hypothetical protein